MGTPFGDTDLHTGQQSSSDIQEVSGRLERIHHSGPPQGRHSIKLEDFGILRVLWTTRGTYPAPF
jgi:hypothetical protein